MTYRGCPTCADIDQWGRAPIGWCGPGCDRRTAHIATVSERRAAAAVEQAEFAAHWRADPAFRHRWGNSRLKRALGLMGRGSAA